MTLDQLKPGQQAIITAIEHEGPLAQRLMALGLLQGTPVSMLRRALGGDPPRYAGAAPPKGRRRRRK